MYVYRITGIFVLYRSWNTLVSLLAHLGASDTKSEILKNLNFFETAQREYITIIHYC